MKFEFNKQNNQNGVVPVFFSSDKNYIPYLTIAIKSLVNFASSKNQYNIYIMRYALFHLLFPVMRKMFRSRNWGAKLGTVFEFIYSRLAVFAKAQPMCCVWKTGGMPVWNKKTAGIGENLQEILKNSF